MNLYTLKCNKKSGLYAVYENGKKVKNNIFSGKIDFEKELSFLGITNYEIRVIN